MILGFHFGGGLSPPYCLLYWVVTVTGGMSFYPHYYHAFTAAESDHPSFASAASHSISLLSFLLIMVTHCQLTVTHLVSLSIGTFTTRQGLHDYQIRLINTWSKNWQQFNWGIIKKAKYLSSC